MGNGDSNKLMAETLGITLDTVKKHVRTLSTSYRQRSRTHAAIIAAQAGIVGKPITIDIETKSAESCFYSFYIKDRESKDSLSLL